MFNQRLPFDIDYKVIGTFTEFYIALLRFVNFKLYKDIGIKYPPQRDAFANESDPLFLCPNKIGDLQAQVAKHFDREIAGSIEQIGVSEEFKNTPELQQLTKKQ